MPPLLIVPPNIMALLPEDFTTGLGARYLAGLSFCVLLRLLLECICGEGSLFPFPGIALLLPLMLLCTIAPPDLIIGFILPFSLCGAVEGRLCAVSSCWCCADVEVDICFFFTLLGRWIGLLYMLLLCAFLFRRVSASGVTGFLTVEDEVSFLMRMGPFIGPFGVFGRFFRLNKLGLL